MAVPRTTATRSILVQQSDGSQMQVDEIPASAKITLGPVSPGKGDYDNRDIALRIYTTAGNQLAVFRNARSFRDLTLKVRVQQVKTSESATAETGPKGSKRSAVAATEFEWVDA